MKRKSPDDGFSYRKTTTALDLSGHDLSALGEEKASTSHVHRFFQNHQTKEVEILDLSRCRLGSQGVSCLVSFLSGSSTTLPCLKRIRLNLNAIGADGGRTIGRLISNNNHNLECIDISLNDIKAGGGEPTAVSIISEALETNTILEELIMDKCAIAPEGATCLAKALVKNESLKVLQLAGNMIGPVGADRLFRALRSNSSLEEIGLKMNRIGGCLDKADVRSLSDALGNDGCCCIAKLDLSYNDLNCTGCVVLSEVMKECSLRDLNLEKNDICSEGAVALANAVAKNLTLRNLVLRGNQIGESGAKALGEMLKQNSALKILDLSSCSIGNDGGSALGIGLSQNATLEHLLIDDNSLGSGKNDAFFSVGLSTNKVLNSLHLSSNGLSDGRAESVWGKAIADALSKNTSLRHVDLSNNELSESSIVDAVASHPTIVYFNLSGNDIESITIDSQLILADRMRTMEMDLSLNPLSSPPLGRLANSPNLQNYLTLLANEKTAITRIRLMVLGFGGVGKSTFARAITYEDDPSDFQSTLIPVQEWGVERLKDWAGRLGTAWAKDAVRLVADEGISGKDLTKYVDRSIDNGSNHSPSELLFDLCSSRYQSIEANSFARAIFSLCAKGYLSTVGAVKVEGTITLGERTCSLVDFAGQTEFLTSHQLLLSSLHTLCLIIQSAPSFGIPDHHHYGSWSTGPSSCRL